MYSSITDSFEKVYPKMSKGGVILVHDFGWERTQGVHKAIQNFLKDKPESIDVKDKIAIIVKQ
jgi:O-methyltransferase